MKTQDIGRYILGVHVGGKLRLIPLPVIHGNATVVSKRQVKGGTKVRLLDAYGLVSADLLIGKRGAIKKVVWLP